MVLINMGFVYKARVPLTKDVWIFILSNNFDFSLVI